MTRLWLVLLIGLVSTIDLSAGGPTKIAKIDRSLWPYEISSDAEFDFASKMEMLVFVKVLQSREQLVAEDSIKKYLGLERISMSSINNWKSLLKKVIIQNFHALGNMPAHDFIAMSKLETWNDIIAAASELEKKLPNVLKAWFLNAENFYDNYAYEQMRLAGLFPRITSEILTLDDSEISGFNYKDKQYLLTFDDGPSAVGGTTDKLMRTLMDNHVNGIFFVLGDMLTNRLKVSSVANIETLYKPMLLGSHGKVHKPHPKFDDWKFSISFTDHLIDSVAFKNRRTRYFRPPYGQRDEKMINFLQEHNNRVMLWNIDSQDWNAKITSHEVSDRVMTLMLLWRRGIILFHDTHSKANEAIPAILKGLKNCNVIWTDVEQLN